MNGEPIGFPYLPLPDKNGRLSWPSLELSVEEQIRVILLTRPGEQLMNPSYAAGIANFLHEPNTLTTQRRLRDAISESLTRWERRIVVDDIAVTELTNDPSRLRVDIAYRLRRTGNAKRLGLTLDFTS